MARQQPRVPDPAARERRSLSRHQCPDALAVRSAKRLRPKYLDDISSGGRARRTGPQGRKGHLVVKYGTFTPKEREDDEQAIPYLRGYTIFSVEQIEHLPDSFTTPVKPVIAEPVPIDNRAERFIEMTGAAITYTGTQACYRPAIDDILIHARERFIDEVHLYSTIFHEIGHWSGANHRLDRDLSGRFGNAAYAAEELVAELSSAFVCADLGIAHDPRDNTASYIDSWLKILKADKRAIVTAAAKAQAVADYLHSLVGSDRVEAA